MNVSSYTGIESIVTVERVEADLDALHEAGGNTVILPTSLDPSIFPVLASRGFQPLTPDGARPYVEGEATFDSRPWPNGDGIVKWVRLSRSARP